MDIIFKKFSSKRVAWNFRSETLINTFLNTNWKITFIFPTAVKNVFIFYNATS